MHTPSHIFPQFWNKWKYKSVHTSIHFFSLKSKVDNHNQSLYILQYYAIQMQIICLGSKCIGLIIESDQHSF